MHKDNLKKKDTQKKFTNGLNRKLVVLTYHLLIELKWCEQTVTYLQIQQMWSNINLHLEPCLFPNRESKSYNHSFLDLLHSLL